MSRKRQAADLAGSSGPTEDFYTSDPINDRSSTFIGRYSPTANAKALQASSDFKDASHRMIAWRKPSTQRVIASASQPRRQLYESGFDDDGEKYGGKKLEKLLDDMQVEGCVVVARWYGGVMLGPVRFTHIESCAREAILRSRAVVATVDPQAEKRRKVQEEEDNTARKAKLERVLQQRDQSITVLRALLAEKSGSSGGSDKMPATPVKAMDYSKMPLAPLVKLEKARDATIGFLLEQISRAEAAVALAEVSVKDIAEDHSVEEFADELGDVQESAADRDASITTVGRDDLQLARALEKNDLSASAQSAEPEDSSLAPG